MTKVLNLDAVKPVEERVLKLHGKEHTMKPMSVGDFIENSRLARASEGNTDPAAEFELVLKMVGKSFPTIPEAELRELTFDQLNTILTWSQADAGEPSEGDEGNAEAAKK